MPETATPLEIVWTFSMLVFGVGLTAINFLYAFMRWRELKRSGLNGVLKKQRGGAWTDQLKLMLVFAALTGVGFLAIASPGTNQFSPATILLLFVGSLLIWLSVSLRIRQTMVANEMIRRINASEPVHLEKEFEMPDSLRRALRTFLQAFLGVLVPMFTAVYVTPGVLPSWEVLQTILIAAGVAGVIALVSFIQNWLEDTRAIGVVLGAEKPDRPPRGT